MLFDSVLQPLGGTAYIPTVAVAWELMNHVKSQILDQPLPIFLLATINLNFFRPLRNWEMYYRYMDDTFVVFSNENDCDLFLDRLNSLHPFLRFTFEKESNLVLPFLDVLVEKSPFKFITSIYPKPTFTGEYLRWNSFSPRKHKANLILTFTHRVFAICSPERLSSELDKIKFILLTNGYPEHVIKSFMAMKMKQFHALPKFEPEKCPVHLRLPWLGSVSTRFEKRVKSAVKQCFSAVEPRVVYSTNELLPATNKDVLPALQKSNMIYQFSCRCDSRYVGRTSQRLQDRIKQHVPKSIRSCSSSQKRLLPARRCKSSTETNIQSLATDSAIGLHLLQISSCYKLEVGYDDLCSTLWWQQIFYSCPRPLTFSSICCGSHFHQNF